MMCQKKHSHNGFSMAEVLITLAIMSIGLVALAKFQGMVMQGGSLSKQRTEAAALGQQGLEALRSFARPTGSGELDYDEIVSGTDTVAGESATYTRTWTVAENTDPNYKTISMVVSWTDQDNVSQQISLGSRINSGDPERSGSLFVLATLAAVDTPILPPTNPPPYNGVPDSAIDNGDGTSDYNYAGYTLTYDNSTGEITHIDGLAVFFINGSITIATGGTAPRSNIDEIGVTPSHIAGSAVCLDNNAGAYTCAVTDGWSGSVVLASPDISNRGDKVCFITYTQPYSSVSGDISSHNYSVIKKSSSCSSPTPQCHQNC